MSGLKRSWNPLLAVQFILQLRQLVRRVQPTIVHLHSSNAMGGALAVRTLGRIRPMVVATIHGLSTLSPGWRGSELLRTLYRLAMTAFLVFVDCIIFVCEADRRLGLQLKLGPASKARLVLNGVATDTPLTSREQAKRVLARTSPAGTPEVGPEDFVVGTIARLGYQKHVELLIDAAAQFRATPRPPRFVIVGGGPDAAKLQRYATEQRVDQWVTFTGPVPEAHRYLAAFDCFALTSRYEGLPYTVLEAAAAGIPVVATDVGGVTEIIEHDHAGRIVPPGDAAALAREIEWVRTNRGEASAQAARAKNKVMVEFSEQAMLARILDVYRELADAYRMRTRETF
jgi:glycosyltransferase involved in cell wall biosynthesis